MEQVDARVLAQDSSTDVDTQSSPPPSTSAPLGLHRRVGAGTLIAAGCVAAALVAHRLASSGSSVKSTEEASGVVLTRHGADHSPKTPGSPKVAKFPVTAFNGSAACSGHNEDCRQSKCCTGHGLQCYEKNEHWAMCMANCTPGVDLRGPDPAPWTCKELGQRSKGDIPPPCAAGGKQCSASKCCQNPGDACYEKMKGLAFCKSSCVPGPDVTDPFDSEFWSCKKLGEDAPGVADWVEDYCAKPGQGCLESGCCAMPNQQCYEQSESWATCKYSCTDPDQPWKGEGWTCKERGPRTPKSRVDPWEQTGTVADWVAEKCAKSGEDCTKSQCCVEAGHQCFVKDKHWSACRTSCVAGPDLWDANYKPWNCSTLGPRTPGYATGVQKTGADPVADWVQDKCGKKDEDCRKTRCCAEPGRQCYAKDDEYATCMRVCEPGQHPDDAEGGEWTCEELGPRTPTLWGSPSLYCIAVIVINGWSSEPDLVKFQIQRSSGIAACDDFAVYSTSEPTYLGVGPQGKVMTIQFEPAEITTSKDGTAGNTELFIHVWESVRRDGRYSALDWTVKVDPDAVLLPDRLRAHLQDHTGKAAYIVNCNKPQLPEGAMMFGALEAFSKEAMGVYYERGSQTCIQGMFWKDWGEDWFMGHCLDALGVQAVHDYSIYSDGVCTGVDCGSNAAAFHPFKDIGSWEACFNTAIGR